MFDWTGYLVLAESLLDGDNEFSIVHEARARCAISRAYYGVAMSARYRLATRGIEFTRSGNVHQELAALFFRSEDVAARELARQLKKLRVLRNLADYDAAFLAQPVAADAVQRAGRCMDMLRAFC